MSICAIFASAALVAVVPPAAAAWLANGPDGGTVASVDGASGRLYIGTVDGVYASNDDGANWSRLGDLPRGTDVSSIAVDPGNRARLFATTWSALYRSTDGGAHWVATAESPRALTFHPWTSDVVGVADYAVTRVSVDGGVNWTDATIVGGTLPLRASVVVADVSYSHAFYALGADRTLYRSINGGRTWSVLAPPLWNIAVPRLAIDPFAGDNLVWSENQLDVAYVSRYVPSTNTLSNSPVPGLDSIYSLLADPLTSGRFWFTAIASSPWRPRLYESTSHGASWSDVGDGSTTLLYASPTTAGVLYGNGTRGFARSADAGRTWQSRTRGLPLAEVHGVSIHPVRGAEILAAGAGFGVALSTDGGVTWNAGLPGMTRENAVGIVRSPQNPEIVYAGTDDGLFRSDDGGRTWQGDVVQAYPYGGPHQFGRLDIDRDDPDKLVAFAGYTGVMWSDDGGVSWRLATTQGSADLRIAPHTASGVHTVYALGFVQSIDHRLYRATAHGDPLVPVPGATFLMSALAVHPGNDREIVALSRQGGWTTWTAYRSTDGGDTWQVRGSLPAMTDLGRPAQLRFDACDPRILYALAGRSFYVSTDRGATWSEDPLAMPLLPSRPINDLDVRCDGGATSVVAASYTGTQVRAPQAIDGIFVDRFE